MNRRPTTREGAIAPQFTLCSVLVLAAGVACVSQAWLFGWWLVAGGAVGVVTAGLLFWRLLHGALIASPLWVLLAGAVTLRAGAPGSVAGWILAAGVLLAVSMLLAAVNRPVGAALTVVLWLGYAAFLLRALPHGVQARTWWPLALLAAVVVLLGTVVSLARSRSSSRGLLKRLGRAGRVSDGMASGWDVYRAASARTVRKNAVVLRPSLAESSRRERRRLPITELGTVLATVGVFKLHSPCEKHSAVFGGPRVGKTGSMMGRLLDAPGAAIVTSTRTDILTQTRVLRGRRGPVWVFDQSGMAEDGSTVTFDPLAGCADPGAAMDRASDLIDGVGNRGTAEGERWDGFAKQTLQALLHAAALGGHSMHHVQQWVADPTTEAKEAVLYELRAANAASFAQQASQFFGNNPNTRSSISTTIMPALAWLSIPSAVASAAPSGEPFDVARLLAERGTAYLVGRDDAKTAPLVTALTAHIAREALRVAARMPGQRLDPQLTMVLDEVAVICPVPLHKWTADFGGHNITLHLAAQSRAQLRDRYGDAAAGTIISNVATILLFGGMKDTDDLSAWSTLCGDRLEQVATRDRDTGSQSITDRRVPVLTAGQIAQLRPGQVLIISGAMPPSIGRVQMAWKRWDVRKVRLAAWSDKRRARFEELVEVWGWRYVHAVAGLFDRVVDLLDRIAGATRPLRHSVAARLAAGLDWLAANDPARELVARLRLSGAMRKARAALDARITANQPTQVTEPTDTDGGKR